MTEQNLPVASLEYAHLDIHDAVLGHKFKLTFIFVTRVFWKSNRGSGLNIAFFFRRLEKIRILVVCRSECRGGGKQGTPMFYTIKDSENLDILSGYQIHQALFQTHSCLVAGFNVYILGSNYDRRCSLRIIYEI